MLLFLSRLVMMPVSMPTMSPALRWKMQPHIHSLVLPFIRVVSWKKIHSVINGGTMADIKICYTLHPYGVLTPEDTTTRQLNTKKLNLLIWLVPSPPGNTKTAGQRKVFIFLSCHTGDHTALTVLNSTLRLQFFDFFFVLFTSRIFLFCTGDVFVLYIFSGKTPSLYLRKRFQWTIMGSWKILQLMVITLSSEKDPEWREQRMGLLWKLCTLQW